jgi:hypothetical protein
MAVSTVAVPSETVNIGWCRRDWYGSDLPEHKLAMRYDSKGLAL